MASRDIGDGLRQSIVSVPDMHCAACIGAVEKALSHLEGVEQARANLSMRSVTVNWRNADAPDIAGALAQIGYSAHLPTSEPDSDDPALSGLIRALAVAGFCSMNIMLLSVSVWTGADAETRQTFHWLSALLAFPAVLYGGATFYWSAWRALRHGRTNMDVPISVGVLLSFGLSLYDTFLHASHAYFEAATSLIFVLLAGRVLDHMMRRKTKSAVAALTRLTPHGANMVSEDGTHEYIDLNEVRPGMRLRIPMGERVVADGVVVQGRSELDSALLTGESLWKTVRPGSSIRAGELNVGSPLLIRVVAAPADSLISKMIQMLEAAEDGRSRYRRLADRAAALYAPVVHGLSFLAFLWWFLETGDVHRSLTIAIAVLIITCPCALGLAVPMVQVVLARRLFEGGIMATDGSAFERLEEIDTVVFDKTGTLTSAEPTLLNANDFSARDLMLAASLARHSTHPMSRALVSSHGENGKCVVFDDVCETSGLGLEGRVGSDIYRLGRAEWTLDEGCEIKPPSAVSLSKNGAAVVRFEFGERIREGATELVKFLKSRGIDVRILSGDTDKAVAAVANAIGIHDWRGGMLPADKIAAIEMLKMQGRKVLMIGDGVNDAPALRCAHVSMAPSSASEVGRTAADFVFLGGDLTAIIKTIDIVARARVLIRQNFGLSVVYNVVSLPIACLGFVTPLAAAIAMSTSSIIVVANALRLRPLSVAKAMAKRTPRRNFVEAP